MQLHQHGMAELFEQLGLGSSPREIDEFIDAHRHPRDTTPHHCTRPVFGPKLKRVFCVKRLKKMPIGQSWLTS